MCNGDSIFVSCLFISRFLIVSAFRHDHVCKLSIVFFASQVSKFIAKREENGAHQLPEAAHSVSSFEGIETTDDSSLVTGGSEHSSQSNFGL